MHLLVRRYITGETRKTEDYGITEDEVMEIRQDISTLKYDIIDILKNNGMRTPMLDKYNVQGLKNISFYSNSFNIFKYVITVITYLAQLYIFINDEEVFKK
jgi:hypothetical protein